MSKWKIGLTICGLALLHFAATMHAGLVAYSMAAGRFDTGGSAPTRREQALRATARVLDLPLSPVRESLRGVGWLEPLYWALFVLNSLLWAAGIYLLVRWVRKVSTGTAGKRA